METQVVDLGEYKVVIEYNNDGSGHLVVTVLDELDGIVEGLEVINE